MVTPTYIFLQHKTTVQVLMSLDQEMDRVTELFFAHNKKRTYVYIILCAHLLYVKHAVCVVCISLHVHAYMCVQLRMCSVCAYNFVQCTKAQTPNSSMPKTFTIPF